MTLASDTAAVSSSAPLVGDAGLGDSLAFTGAGPFTVLLAILGMVSAVGGAVLRFASNRLRST